VSDAAFMARALALAERARGLTSPNPMVGAVVVRDGAVVGEGWHAAAGQPHAEVVALRAAGARARDATLYVTLEPCAHQGRTPPCLPVVLAAGVRRVVAATLDPNPFVPGGGAAALRAAGVDTVVGVLAEEAARLNRVFFTAMRERRPHVTLKAAASLDGRIADLHGASRWITGEAARARAHRMRAEADAVLVGVGTVLRDDPRLDVRLEASWPREPFRVVLDARARTPIAARLLASGRPERAMVAVAEDAPAERVAALRAAGATLVACPRGPGGVAVTAVLEALFAREVRAVLVEGGAEVHATFVEAGLVDRVAVFLAPLLLGGREAPAVVGGRGLDLKGALRLDRLETTALGPDLLVEAEVRRDSGAPSLRDSGAPSLRDSGAA
jgi:diaminohydroxyphosphoribosylaminopyrimidine deaminase/5-amino-6-(5-phosphoribosylamino)uracil reductase